MEGLSKEKLDLVHQGIIETVKEFIKVCESHNFKYFITAGTLLGAVRHKGFIPWDDDMDVFVPREDYEKLLEIEDSELPNHMELVHYTKTEGEITYTVIRIKNKHYKTTEDLAGKKITSYVFLDVFPLDGFPEGKFKSFIHKIRLKYRMAIVRFSRLQLHQEQKDVKTNRNIIEKIVYKTDRKLHLSKFLNYKKQMYKFDKALMKYPYSKSKKVFFATGDYGMFTEIFPKTLFETTKMYPFEDIELRGVADYDTPLRQVYGDYMKLPPVEERICKHTLDVEYVKE